MSEVELTEGPLEVADGIYWVGRRSGPKQLCCNPFLVVAGDAAVLIDGGSRPDFPAVMTQVLEAGVDPERIVALVYQHCDPDLCGSMQNMVEMCGGDSLAVLVSWRRAEFFKSYLPASRHHLLRAIEDIDFTFSFGGRELRFLQTPYCHDAASLVTYDEQTRTLFSSDLFGTYAERCDLFGELPEACRECPMDGQCPGGLTSCPVRDTLSFHLAVMPSEKALRHAMRVLRDVDFEILAPQHGCVLTNRRDIEFLMAKLENLSGVGIDGIA